MYILDAVHINRIRLLSTEAQSLRQQYQEVAAVKASEIELLRKQGKEFKRNFLLRT